MLATAGQSLPNVATTMLDFGPIWPTPAQQWPESTNYFGRHRPKHGQNRPSLADVGSLARVGRQRPKVAWAMVGPPKLARGGRNWGRVSAPRQTVQDHFGARQNRQGHFPGRVAINFSATPGQLHLSLPTDICEAGAMAKQESTPPPPPVAERPDGPRRGRPANPRSEPARRPRGGPLGAAPHGTALRRRGRPRRPKRSGDTLHFCRASWRRQYQAWLKA